MILLFVAGTSSQYKYRQTYQKQNTLVNKILSHERFIVSNVTFHSESKYAIKIFPSPTVFVQWLFYYWFFEILAIFFSDFFYMNKYFKLFWTEGGHIQFTIIKSLAVCAQKQVVNETNVDSWR
jgi:hypothetical protein